MNNETQKSGVELAIRRVKLISFSVKEGIPPEETLNANINIEHKLEISVEKELIIMILKVVFSSSKTNTEFMSGEVLNIFHMKGLASFVNPQDNRVVNIPDTLIVTMLSISVSHTRALLAQQAMGSAYNDIYIPLVDPQKVALQLFGSVQQSTTSAL